MASSPTDSAPFSGADVRMYADIRDSDSDTGTDTHSQASSAFTASDLDHIRNICHYRTPQFHDRECSRFFDCPSHIVERSLSDAGSIHAEAHDTHEEVDASHHDNGQDVPSTTDLSDHERYHDSDVHSHQSSPDREDASNSNNPTNPPEQNTPAPEANATSDEGDIITTLQALQMTPPQTEVGSNSRSSEESRNRAPDLPSEYSLGILGTRIEGERPISGLPVPRQRTPVSRERMDAPLPSPRRQRTPSESQPPLPRPPRGQVEPDTPSDWSLPRWQSDAEVTYCPICRTQFSFFVRKHHCRKCGRVVCNSCSPHRIIIPYQYIVRPPGQEVGVPPSFLIDGMGTGYFDVNNVAGGERVRLCNPCVPDPNTAPPHSPNSPAALSPRTAHARSRSSAGGGFGTLPTSNRHGAIFAPGNGGEPYQYLRSRSITMATPGSSSGRGSSRRARSGAHQTPIERILSGDSSSSYPARYGSLLDVGSSSRQRALPPTPQIPEEDECPICHRELPSRTLPNFEALRETHITTCIQSHSTYGTPRQGDASPVAPRRTGMYTYPATEKDCIDDAECTICLEEFTVGIPMARLECLCRFHRSCISAWFVNHPGRCPVHQHDGFGY